MYCAFSIPVHQSLNIQENEVEMSELLNQLWTPELQAAFTVVVVLLVILYVLSIVWVVRDAYLRGSYWYVWAIVALVPLLGIIAYCLLRPPLLQIDRDEQELEIALKQRELMKYGECANCGYPVEADFVLCPNCHQRLKNLRGKYDTAHSFWGCGYTDSSPFLKPDRYEPVSYTHLQVSPPYRPEAVSGFGLSFLLP